MAERIDVGLPDGLDVVHHGSHVEIVLKWFSWKVVGLTAFALVWDGFLVNWYVNIAPRAMESSPSDTLRCRGLAPWRSTRRA